MRTFLLGLIILFEFLFCGVNSAQSVVLPQKNSTVIQSVKTDTTKEIHKYNSFEHAILRLNNGSEIYTSLIRESYENSYNSAYINPKDFNISEKFYIYNLAEKLFNISSYLTDEICTRAP